MEIRSKYRKQEGRALNKEHSQTELKFDVVTLGRSSVDLYGTQMGGRLEDMSSFSKYVGGCPTNIAIGTSKLGLSSAIITGVGNDHMGRFIQEELVANGVSLDGVKIDNERLTALVLLGIRDQETFPLIFYRENCADMALAEEDVAEELISASASLLLSGTHLSTLSTFAASQKAISIAKASGKKIIFDIDYRPVLWGTYVEGCRRKPICSGRRRHRENSKMLQLIVILSSVRKKNSIF